MRLLHSAFKKLLLLFVPILCDIPLFAQSLEELDSLDTKLEQYYFSERNAQLEEFADLKEMSWVLFIPGVGFDFINRRPYIVYNTSSLFSFLNQRKKNKHKRNSIIQISALRLYQDRIKLRRLYLKLSSLFDEYNLEFQIYNDYKKLFSIKKGAYDNDEILLETLITAGVQIKNKKKDLFAIEEKIHDVALQIELLTHRSLNYSFKQTKGNAAKTLPNVFD